MTDINFYSAVVKPGDTLVVATPTLRNRAEADELSKELESCLPGIRVVVVCAYSLAAVRPDDVV
jgi:hypothetical protein